MTRHGTHHRRHHTTSQLVRRDSAALHFALLATLFTLGTLAKSAALLALGLFALSATLNRLLTLRADTHPAPIATSHQRAINLVLAVAGLTIWTLSLFWSIDSEPPSTPLMTLGAIVSLGLHTLTRTRYCAGTRLWLYGRRIGLFALSVMVAMLCVEASESARPDRAVGLVLSALYGTAAWWDFRHSAKACQSPYCGIHSEGAGLG
ncbi:hypothetical protein KUV89_18785 [Marinobacter hydrocarbonoclasticus]|nr:hypothetical protein [Marinobacter nauticus]